MPAHRQFKITKLVSQFFPIIDISNFFAHKEDISEPFILNHDRSHLLSFFFNPLSAGDAFKRIHTVFPQLKFDRN